MLWIRAIWRALRRWLPFIIVAALLYFLVKTVNPEALVQSARQFQMFYLLPLAGSFLVYLALRAARWHFLLRPLKVPNTLADSLLLFAAAQAAVLLPAGQFLLPVLQKSQYGTLIRRSAATVLVQELVFGILVLPAALPGVPGYRLGAWLLLGAFIISTIAGALILNQTLSNLGIAVLKRTPILKRHVPSFRDLRSNVVMVASTPEAVIGSVLDMGAIAAAGTGLYIALIGLGQSAPGWTGAVGTYAFGSAVGTLTSLPGGLGANEDVSTAVLSHMGLAPGPAAAATLIFRATTLLLGVVLGWLTLLLFRHRFHVHPSVNGIVEAVKRGATEAETGVEPRSPKQDPATKPLIDNE